MAHEIDLMEKIQSLAKRRGFIYQGSEIYGGLAGTWDYGPLGVALKNTIKDSWRKKFVASRTDMYEVDAAILMNPKVWEAAGHVATFTDPLVECKNCNSRQRVDQLISKKEILRIVNIVHTAAKKQLISTKSEREILETIQQYYHTDSKLTPVVAEQYQKSYNLLLSVVNNVDKMLLAIKQAENYQGLIIEIILSQTRCPVCMSIEWTEPRQFNMMFSTKVGAAEDSASTVYLRPETAQGMFVNFKNIIDSFHPKLPFGMAQIGKAFRNEITPRDFVFRVREFEQMEIEYFVKPEDWNQYFEYFKDEMLEWMESVGLDMSKIHELEVSPEDLAHYSKRTVDFEFDYPFGRKELYGLAYRTSFDLDNHSNGSGTELSFQDEESKSKVTPHIIEPSFGVERTVLALLMSAYTEEQKGDDTRVFLKFKPSIAPVVCAVSPLLKNKPELIEKAQQVFGMLKAEFGRVMWDDNGNIGKRYRRQDEIGTPWCIVIDFDTLGEGEADAKETVTVRDRDTGAQERIAISDLVSTLRSRLS